MKNGRKLGRAAHQRHLMAALTRARPASLDADATLRSNWPQAAEIIEAARLADDGQTCYQSALRRKQFRRKQFRRKQFRRKPTSLRPGRLAQSDRGKLIGAMASAAVTAAVIVIGVATGAILLGQPHQGPPPGSGHPTPASGPMNTPLTFHSLPLGANWRGHLAYATRDGVVFLTGSVRLPGPREALATLPPQARPGGPLQIVASLGLGRLSPEAIAEVGSIEVATSGVISVTGPSSRSLNRVTYVSLDGVSFPIGSR